MKKGLSILIILFLIGCSTKRSATETKPLFLTIANAPQSSTTINDENQENIIFEFLI